MDYGLIPIAYGSPRNGYKAMAPEGSFIYVEDFKSGKELAKEMSKVAKDPKKISSFYQWHYEYDKVDCIFTKYCFRNLCKRLFAEDSTGCKSNPEGKSVVLNDVCYPAQYTIPNLKTPFGTCHGPTIVG